MAHARAAGSGFDVGLVSHLSRIIPDPWNGQEDNSKTWKVLAKILAELRMVNLISKFPIEVYLISQRQRDSVVLYRGRILSEIC